MKSAQVVSNRTELRKLALEFKILLFNDELLNDYWIDLLLSKKKYNYFCYLKDVLMGFENKDLIEKTANNVYGRLDVNTARNNIRFLKINYKNDPLSFIQSKKTVIYEHIKTTNLENSLVNIPFKLLPPITISQQRNQLSSGVLEPLSIWYPSDGEYKTFRAFLKMKKFPDGYISLFNGSYSINYIKENLKNCKELYRWFQNIFTQKDLETTIQVFLKNYNFDFPEVFNTKLCRDDLLDDEIKKILSLIRTVKNGQILRGVCLKKFNYVISLFPFFDGKKILVSEEGVVNFVIVPGVNGMYIPESLPKILKKIRFDDDWSSFSFVIDSIQLEKSKVEKFYETGYLGCKGFSCAVIAARLYENHFKKNRNSVLMYSLLSKVTNLKEFDVNVCNFTCLSEESKIFNYDFTSYLYGTIETFKTFKQGKTEFEIVNIIKNNKISGENEIFKHLLKSDAPIEIKNYCKSFLPLNNFKEIETENEEKVEEPYDYDKINGWLKDYNKKNGQNGFCFCKSIHFWVFLPSIDQNLVTAYLCKK